MEQKHPELTDWGDMPIEMVREISRQIPKGVFIQLHNNGEPLLYPDLMKAMRYFDGSYIGLNTNGKLLIEQNKAICRYLSSITISIIPDDPEGEEQLEIAEEFLGYDVRPLVVFRLLGRIDQRRKLIINNWSEKHEKVEVCHRILHSPDGSFEYEKPVTKPEIGICLEMLHKLAIDRYGNVYPCVRFDPEKKNLLGNVSEHSLLEIWNSVLRKLWVQYHINGRRDKVGLCQACKFWGVPRS